VAPAQTSLGELVEGSGHERPLLRRQPFQARQRLVSIDVRPLRFDPGHPG
jgi:hypothetical protein